MMFNRRLLLFAFCLATSFPCFAQWTLLPQIPGLAQTEELEFVSEQIGILVGHDLEQDLVVHRTTDGGQTWSLVYEDTSFNYVIKDLDMLHDGVHGAFCGALGYLVKTDDAGSTWQPVPAPTPSMLMSVSMLDHDSFLISALSSTNYQTDDGGSSFYPRTDLLGLSDLEMLDASSGHMYSNLALMRTTDGGQTWSTMPMPPGVSGATGLAFLTTDIGCLYFSPLGTVNCTFNGGNTWHTDSLNGGFGIVDISMSNMGVVLVGGMGIDFQDDVCYSLDTGRTWVCDADLEGATLGGVAAYGSVAYAASVLYPNVWRFGAGVGVADPMSLPSVRIWPDPVQDRLFVDGGIRQATIFEASGRCVERTVMDAGTNWLDVSSLQAGLYLALLTGANGTWASRFIKE